jgi:hypothetical protein
MRRCLNYIAHRDETKGIVFDPDGNLQELDTINFPEGRYEAELLCNSAHKFEEFDTRIRTWAKQQQNRMNSAIGEAPMLSNEEKSVTDSPGSRRPHPSQRGVTLAQLRSMREKLTQESENWDYVGRKEDKKEGGEIYRRGLLADAARFKKITLYDITYESLKKGTPDEFPTSYMEKTFGDREQQPEFFLSVPYQTTVHELLIAIEWHAEARHLVDHTVYWAWFLSLSMGDLRDAFAQPGKTPTDTLLDTGIELSGFVQVFDPGENATITVKSLNPVIEYWQWLVDWNTSETGGHKKLTIDLSSVRGGVLSTHKPFPGGSYEFGSFPLDAAHALCNFDLMKLENVNQERLDAFMEVMKKKGGREQFEREMRMLASGPLLRSYSTAGDGAALKDIVAKTGVGLLRPEIRGVYGESPLMLAASKGNIAIMDTLLQLKASLYDRDSNGETPLHYAALAGRADSAKLLLRHDAEILDVVSSFEETALDVARQNPGEFLGIDTSELQSLLENFRKCADLLKGAERLRKSMLEDVTTPEDLGHQAHDIERKSHDLASTVVLGMIRTQPAPPQENPEGGLEHIWLEAAPTQPTAESREQNAQPASASDSVLVPPLDTSERGDEVPARLAQMQNATAGVGSGKEAAIHPRRPRQDS